MTDRQKDVQVARNLLGMKSDYIYSVWMKFASNYGWDGAWCSEAACCVSYLAGNLGKIPVSNYAYGLVQKFKTAGMFGHEPALGAFIFFDYKDGNGPSHTGRVVEISNGLVTTIEGNIGGQVVSRYYSINDNIIYGYGYPGYDDEEPVPDGAEFGIDISRWQGDFDVQRAKDNNGIKFVIIKAGGGEDGLYVDSQFVNNYGKAKAAGLPVGCYWFSKAVTVDEARAEAEFFYQNCLAGRKFELPVYMDVEHGAQLALGQPLLTSIVMAWCEYLAARNYYVGIYSTKNVFTNYMYDAELQKYAHWIAYWGESYNYDKNVGGMWQFGAETNYLRDKYINGQIVDQNYKFRDYESEIKSAGMNGFGTTPKPEPQPKPEPSKAFSDIPEAESYYKPVMWAVENDIVRGYADGTFKPENSCTRAQFVTMVWRMAGRPKAEGEVTFTDVSPEMSSYRAIQWAVENGIIVGYKDDTFRPDNILSREQAAVIIWRWQNRPFDACAAVKDNPFRDVNPNTSLYRAILWGAESGVIKGYSDGTFRPKEACRRKHAVTFLYRLNRILQK